MKIQTGQKLQSGFTLIEIMVALVIMAGMLVYMVNNVPITNFSSKNLANKLKSDLTSIELAYNNYILDHGSLPADSDSDGSVLDDLGSAYIFPPMVPKGFTGEYQLVENSGDIYACVQGDTLTIDYIQEAIEKVNDDYPEDKVIISTTCGSDSDSSVDSNSCVTFWIRQN